MQLFKSALIITAVALFVIACNKTENRNAADPAATPTETAKSSPTPDAFADTRAFYQAHCALCHQPDGTGGTPIIEGKRLKVPTLRTGHATKHTDAELADQIAEGGDGMPAFKDKRTPAQISELVRFVRAEFQGQTAAPSTAPNAAPPAK